MMVPMDNLKGNLYHVLDTTGATHPLELLSEIMQHLKPYFDISDMVDGAVTLRIKDDAITEHAYHIAHQADVL